MYLFASLPSLVSAHAVHRGSSTATLASGYAQTWSMLEENVSLASATLTSSGVSPGSAIILTTSDGPSFVIYLLAILRCGAQVVPLPTDCPRSFLEEVRRSCDAQFTIVPDSADRASDKGDISLCLPPLPPHKILRTDQFRQVLQSRTSPNISNEADIFSILYSSGTTGTPKGVVHTHGARARTISTLIDTFRLNVNSRTLIATPLYTCLTWDALLPTIAAGGTCIFMDEFSPSGFLKAARSTQPSFAYLVPAQFATIIECVEFDESALRCFSLLACAGARLDATLKARLIDILPLSFMELYGATEGDAFTSLPAQMMKDKIGSVGRALPNVTVRILHTETHKDLPAYELGEVAIVTPGIMSGYFGNPHQTQRVLLHDPAACETLYLTGDIGFLDKDLYLYLQGRKSELIISGGHNIFPKDIEQTLLQHEDVEDAAVIGHSLPPYGETPLAFVVVRPGSTSSSTSICAWVNARLANHQRVYEVRILNCLPRNAAGKVVKAQLRSPLVSREFS